VCYLDRMRAKESGGYLTLTPVVPQCPCACYSVDLGVNPFSPQLNKERSFSLSTPTWDLFPWDEGGGTDRAESSYRWAFFVCVWWDYSLNAGPMLARQALYHLYWMFLRYSLSNYLPGLASNLNAPDLCLLSS
jgi:hypothetical protein